MIKLERTDVMNFENAIRGMRNPLDSWEKSDSGRCSDEYCTKDKCPMYLDGYSCVRTEEGNFIISYHDLALAKKLCKAGSDHRKFLRQIFVSVDITAPLYWWKEYDTYKVGTTANSCSTMHTIHKEELTIDNFSHDHCTDISLVHLKGQVSVLNALRGDYLRTKDKLYWYSMIQLLPSSFNQMRTCTLTYENLLNMYHARKNHKLDEWREFCKWVEELPYAKELITNE